MSILLIGLIGAAILIFGWGFETIEAVRRHKSLVDLKFAFNHLIGISFLLAYSTLINDSVFMPLNAIIVSLIAIEIWYSLHIKKIHKNKPHSKERRRK
ncbi:MAG TPA: hypothetical protein VJA47_02960 [archaeon]|nr:hypothetical protein [archaeon]